MVAFLITQNQTRGKRSITSIKQMQRVQFSIIKCYFYTKMRYIRVDIPHIMFVLFTFIACSKPKLSTQAYEL